MHRLKMETLLANANVTLRFKGLMVLCFEKDRRWGEVALHTLDNGHELGVCIQKQVGSGPLITVSSFTFQHDFLRTLSQIWLYLTSGEVQIPEENSVQPYQGASGDEKDFSHIVDFEGGHFCGEKLERNPDALKPSLFITKGVFYTAQLWPADCKRMPLEAIHSILAITERPFGQVMDEVTNLKNQLSSLLGELGPIADYVGVDIEVGEEEALVLRLGDQGNPLFQFKPEPNSKYIITFENLPPNNQHNLSAQAVSPHRHDPKHMYHFLHYYDAFKIARNEQKYIIEDDKGNISDRTRDVKPEPPCGVVYQGSSSSEGKMP